MASRPKIQDHFSILILALFGVAVLYPILSSGTNWGIWDWDHHLAMLEVERQAILEHHVIPLWNPYIAGGTFILQHPLSSFLIPDWVLVLIFGSVGGAKALIVFRFVVGACGAWMLARRLGLSREGAALCAILMNGSGAWVVHLTYGHLEWTLVGYVPWVLLSLLQAANKRSIAWGSIGAVGIAMIYVGGGVYLLFGLAFLAVTLFAARATLARDWRPLAFGLLPFALAGLLAGAKLLPAWEMIKENPRRVGQGPSLFFSEPSQGVREVFKAGSFLFLRRAEPTRIPESMLLHEFGRRMTDQDRTTRFLLFQDINFGGYVGFIPCFLFIVALASRPRESLPWFVAFMVVLILVISDSIARATGFNPWESLRQLPILGSLRSGGRFLIIATVPFSILAGAGLSRIQETRKKASKRTATTFALVLVAVVALDLGSRGASILSGAFPFEAREVNEAATFVTRRLSEEGFDLLSVKNRIGSFAADSNLIGFPRAAIPSDDSMYRGEAFLVGATGSVDLESIRPNELRVKVRPARNGRLVVNQNFATGWERVDREESVQPFENRLSTPVTSDDQVVHLRFGPRLLWPGIVVSLASLGLLLAVVGAQLSSIRQGFSINQDFRNR